MGQIQSPTYTHGGGDRQGSSVVKGERAGEVFASDEELDEKEAQEEYAKSQGATGIAGGAKRAKPEYKAGYAKWRPTFKSKRMRAPKPAPSPSPTPAATPAPGGLTDIAKKK